MPAPRTNASHDQNRVPTLIGVSSTDGTTPVPVEVDPTTGAMLTSGSGGGGGSDVQYTDGAATVAHPVGTIPVFDKAGTITAVSSANPLPTSATVDTTGLATSAKQDTGNTSLASIDGKITAVNTGAVTVASSALPTGAATAAKQPALGTAGSPSTDVISVQGVASGTPQPVSGTVTANMGTTNGLALDATLTGGTQQAKLTDGTNVANVLKSDGTAAGQNAALVGAAYLPVTFTTSSNTTVGATDAGNYGFVSVQVTSVGTSGVGTFQASNDNSTWVSISLSSVGATGNSAPATSANATGIYAGPLNARYFRISVASLAAGSYAGTIHFSLPHSPTIQATNTNITSFGTNAAATGNGTASTTALRVTVASDSTGQIALAAGSAAIGSVTTSSATVPVSTMNSASANSGVNSAMAAVFDDVSPTAITENSFGFVRMSANRNQYSTIRDAAGNERGVNVTAGNALTVDGSATTQPVSYATTGSGTATGALRVELANNGTGAMSTVSTVTSLTQMNGAAIAMNTGTRSAGTQRVTIATDDVVPASQSGTWTVQPGNTANSTPWLVTDTPATSGGLSIKSASTGGTATSIKASAGQLYAYHLFNTTAAAAYVQLFNVASGSVTLGTTVPDISIGIPASGGVTLNIDKGIPFGTAISYACTTTRTGSTGATCDVNFYYK